MGKKTKIKRYDKIYRKRPSSKVFRVILFIVICAGLFFVGWSVAPPVIQFFRGTLKPSSDLQSSAILPSSSEESSESSEEESVESPDISATMKTQEIPAADLADPAKLEQWMQTFQANGINTVLCEIKDQNGRLLYNSKAEQAVSIGAVAAPNVEIQAGIETLKAAGVRVIAKMYAFEDNLAALKIRDAAVKYKPNPAYLWLDKSEDAGGRAWLDPSAPLASQYLISLAEEAVGLGFEGIILESVHFPEAVSYTNAQFSGASDPAAMQQALTAFIQQITQAVKAKGADLYVAVDGGAATDVGTEKYGGSPFAWQVDNLLVDLRPSSLGATVKIGEVTIDVATAKKYDLLKPLAEAIFQKSGKKEVMCWFSQALNAEDELSVCVQALLDGGLDGSYLAQYQ